MTDEPSHTASGTNIFGQPVPAAPTSPIPPQPQGFSPAGGSNAFNQGPPVKVDHLYEIAELARSLHNVSPSGAETVSAKILQHIADIQDPKAYDERMAAEKKVHDEAVAASKKAKEAANKAA